MPSKGRVSVHCIGESPPETQPGMRYWCLLLPDDDPGDCEHTDRLGRGILETFGALEGGDGIDLRGGFAYFLHDVRRIGGEGRAVGPNLFDRRKCEVEVVVGHLA